MVNARRRRVPDARSELLAWQRPDGIERTLSPAGGAPPVPPAAAAM
jgi:hypothetical protein